MRIGTVVRGREASASFVSEPSSAMALKGKEKEKTHLGSAAEVLISRKARLLQLGEKDAKEILRNEKEHDDLTAHGRLVSVNKTRQGVKMEKERILEIKESLKDDTLTDDERSALKEEKEKLLEHIVATSHDDKISMIYDLKKNLEVKIAKAHEASVPFMRSPSASDDYATTVDVLHEVLSAYAEREKKFDFMCCLYPTAPFVTAEKIRAAYTAFMESGADMLEPVVAFSYPPQRSFSIEAGLLAYNYPEHVRTRSQDLPTWYHDAGQFYFYRVEAFRRSVEGNSEQGGYDLRCVPFVMNEMEVQDIDTIMDWQLAEAKYRLLQEM